ncbi:MAG: FAD-binding domain-containing protein [Pseudomonadota bacterium]
MCVILWFKRDLRVSDHPALAHAAALGPVVPLFIHEPGFWAQRDVSGRQWDFVQESLADLRSALADLGLTLVERTGAAQDVLEAVRAEVKAAHLVSHEETGSGWTYTRDKEVAAWARDAGVIWEELAQSGVVRRLQGRDGWAQQRNAFLRQPQVTPQGLRAGVALVSDPVPRLVAADHCPARQPGGRRAGLALLGSFLTQRGRTYRAAMSTPLEGEWACSRLSPHLAWGTLSGREASQATAARQREVKGTREGWGGSLKSFQARLAWRDHFMQKLEDEPQVEHRCLHSAYDGMRGDDTARRMAWERGETGLPFVDACMRMLAATGWMNFRMRSMLMAVASYHLWLDWRLTGAHLARQFTDFEAGIHWPQTQMQSGTTGMNTVRIYNPVKQGLDQDPEGIFTRRWCPELEHVPLQHLQTPWAWDGAAQVLDRAYPAPIVDVKEAARQARERIWAVRRGGEFRAEAARIVDKHASRKDPQRHFVQDRDRGQARARRQAQKGRDAAQGSFDF